MTEHGAPFLSFRIRLTLLLSFRTRHIAGEESCYCLGDLRISHFVRNDNKMARARRAILLFGWGTRITRTIHGPRPYGANVASRRCSGSVLSSVVLTSLRTPELAFLRCAFLLRSKAGARRPASPLASPFGEPRFSESQTVHLTPRVLILAPNIAN